jgi:hypothetical protein
MKAYVGWDPGQAGAIAILFENGTVTFQDWVNEGVMFELLKLWGRLYHIVAVAIEKQHGMKGNSAKANTSFQQHTGACKCVIKLAGFEPVEVRPQEWMKRRVPAKKNPKDKPSVLYVEQRYPYVELRGPMGGVKDGRSDAICIAEWCRDKYKEVYSGS